MKKFILDPEEQEILRAYEAGEYRPLPNQKKLLREAQLIARNTMAKNKNINLRISEKVLLKLKSKALEEGLPYQTLASSILHKYAMS